MRVLLCLAPTVLLLCASSVYAADSVDAVATPEANHAAAPTPRAALLAAPFGFAWLSSPAAAREVGLDLGPANATRFGDSYVVSDVPAGLPDQKFTVLSYGFDERLIRITATGGGFTRDHELKEIEKRYRQLQELLRAKYGDGREDHHIDPKWSGGRAALGLQSKANRMLTVFNASNIWVELSMFSEAGAITSWRIVFEHKAGMRAFEKARALREESVL